MRTLILEPLAVPTVLGADDWAWRRGQCYGTVRIDLERRQEVIGCLLAVNGGWLSVPEATGYANGPTRFMCTANEPCRGLKR
jgi:hypothetical protein